MRKILLVFLVTSFWIMSANAQVVPSGMKYQAVARNSAGAVIPNSSITLRIDLKGDPSKGGNTYYSEEHTVTTNQFSLDYSTW